MFVCLFVPLSLSLSFFLSLLSLSLALSLSLSQLCLLPVSFFLPPHRKLLVSFVACHSEKVCRFDWAGTHLVTYGGTCNCSGPWGVLVLFLVFMNAGF